MAKWTIGPGDWCHIDIPTSDRGLSKEFYGAVFGWQLQDLPEGDYTMITTSEDGILSGIGSLAAATGRQSPATGPVPYIRPENFEDTLAAVERAGGEVIIPKTDVLGYGWFAHFRDPDGNVIGLWMDAESHSD
jgi:predicted enzyme related to lactoylglutathione lyase